MKVIPDDSARKQMPSSPKKFFSVWRVAECPRCSVATQTCFLVATTIVMLSYLLVAPFMDKNRGQLHRFEHSKTATAQTDLPHPAGDDANQKLLGEHSQHILNRYPGPLSQAIHSSKISTEPFQPPHAPPKEPKTHDTTRQRKIKLNLLAQTTLETFADPTSGTYPAPVVCRVYNSCTRRDGTIVLSEKLRTFKPELRSCGARKVEFADMDSVKPAQVFTADFFPITLRYHMPHLASDILSLSYAMSAVIGRYGLTAPIPERSAALKPIVVAQDRVRELPPHAWTSRVLSMLPENTTVMTDDEIYSLKGSPICFRSTVIYSSQAYWQVGARRFDSFNLLFERNDFRRGHDVLLSTPSKFSCTPNILVLNRSPGEQRTIANAHDIVKSFQRLISDSPTLRNASIHMKYMNLSFEDQVRVMQEADIILASHGAALANLLFARKQTPVIEILPFSKYYPCANSFSMS